MNLAFPVITFPYASRILQPEGIGKINFANSIISYFILIASLGISTYATRECAKIRDNKLLLSKFAVEMMIINSISTLVAYVLFFIVYYVSPKLHYYQALLTLCSFKIVFSFFGIDWLYRGLEDFKYITLRSVIFQILSLCLLFIFVKTKEDILWYAAIGILSSVGSNILSFIHARKFIIFKTDYHLELRKHLKPIFVFFGMEVVTSVYTILDTTMTGFLSNDVQVGYYSAANKLNKMILGIITSIIAILLPRFSYYAGKNDYTRFRILLKKCLHIVVFFSLPSIAGLLILSRPLVLLFSGNAYLPAVTTMRLLTPVILLITMSSLIGIQLLTPLNKEKFTLRSVIFGAVTNLTGNYFLIPRYGANGAAFATVCAESVVTLTQLFYAKSYLDWKDFFINIMKSLIGTLCMAATLLLLAHYLCGSNFLQIAVSFIIGGIIYFTVMTILKDDIPASVFQVFLKFILDTKKGKK